MKLYIGLLSLSLLAGCINATTQTSSTQGLSKAVSQNNDDALWDGETFSGWQFVDGTPAASDRWVIQGGSLDSIKSDVKREKDSQSLFTEQSYSNFELTFEFIAQEGANSGVKYLALRGEKSLPEYQLVKPEAEALPSKRGLGSLFDIATPQNLSNPDQAALQLAADGAWNVGKIIVKGQNVQHWLNGIKIVDIDRCSAEFDAQVRDSLFKDEDKFAKRTSGKIMLQYNDGGVKFRNLRIKDFGGSSASEYICE